MESPPAPATFAAWLRDLMERRGYPMDGPRAGGIAKLAIDSGVSQPSISRIFNAEGYSPSVETLRALAPVLGVSLREMMIRSGRATEDELPIVRYEDAKFRAWFNEQRKRTGMSLRDIAGAIGFDVMTIQALARGPHSRGETIDALLGSRLSLTVKLAQLFEQDAAEVLEMTGFVDSAERILEVAGARGVDPVISRIESSTLSSEAKKALTEQYRREMEAARSRTLDLVRLMEHKTD